MKKPIITIGADPELFFKNNTGKLISVVGLLGGSKEEPLPIGEGCGIQEDNVAAEFCIPPSDNAAAFVKSIQYSMQDIEVRAAKLGLTLATLVASGSFDRDQLMTSEARRFGCDPDYNAYTKQANPRPQCTNLNLRSAGGHIHVGTENNPWAMARVMDLMLGVPSVIMDNDTERRSLYGQAGALRPKPYGLEYRTLSNFWIWNKETIEWVYHQVQESVKYCEEFDKECSPEQSIEFRACINNNDRELAKRLVKDWSLQTR